MQLEHLTDEDWGTVRRNFERLRGTLDAGGTVASIRFGVDTATWAANRYSAEATVTHGLGRAPVAVFVTGATDQGTSLVAYQAFAYTDTTFKVRGDFTNGAAPSGNSSFAWIAIG